MHMAAVKVISLALNLALTVPSHSVGEKISKFIQPLKVFVTSGIESTFYSVKTWSVC